jgi:energy-coupling factor transport system ATP-binding protein
LSNQAIASAENVSVRFGDNGPWIVREASLAIWPGEIVVIAGPSGSGKSTLCSLLAGIIPHFQSGVMEGQVKICGQDTQLVSYTELVRNVSTVFQNPETNIFALKAIDDVAFGPENIGSSVAQIQRCVTDAADWTMSWPLLPESTGEMSGGQKQRLAIASSLAIMPKLLILDEPTTDLDPVGKRQVAETLAHLRGQIDLALVVVEHDLSNVVAIADRLVLMEAGRIVIDASPRHVLENHREHLVRLGIRVPAFADIGYVLRDAGAAVPIPLTEQEMHAALQEHPLQAAEVRRHIVSKRDGSDDGSQQIGPSRALKRCTDDPVIEFRDVEFRYRSREAPTLTEIDLRVERGELVAIVGPNGSGKSTLLRLMMGFERATKGEVLVAGLTGRRLRPHRLAAKVGYGFQNPDHQLFERTVRDECAFSLRRSGLSEETVELRVQAVLTTVGLEQYADRHPATLSRGEKRRLAVATALVLSIDVLLLDEPTTGQDSRTLAGLFEIIGRLHREEHTTVLMVTHDLEIVWRYATRVIGVCDGHVLFDGAPDVMFSAENEHLLRRAQLEPPLYTTVDAAVRARDEFRRSGEVNRT